MNNEEIKEILDNLEDIGFMYKRISPEEIKKILDYITNLQEENERLKNGYCKLKVKCNNGDCDCTNEEYDGMAQANMRISLLLDDYKSRIDKAIEYIKLYCVISDEWTDLDFCKFVPTGNIKYKSLSSRKVKYLLNILQGSDKDE